MEIVLLIALTLLTLVGVMLAVLQLPGAWLILAGAFGYDWYGGWQRIGWEWLLALAVLAAAAELIDALTSVLATRRCGASKRAAVGALVGGFAGMIVLSIPIPVLGTIIGGLIGCFVGAVAGELTTRDDLLAGARVGLFATIGRVIGLAVKTAAAMVIGAATILLAIQGLP